MGLPWGKWVKHSKIYYAFLPYEGGIISIESGAQQFSGTSFTLGKNESQKKICSLVL